MMLKAADWPLTIWAGAVWDYSFSLTVDGDPMDLTEYTARLSVRKTVDAEEVVFQLDEEIALTEEGMVSWHVDDEVTGELAPDDCVYEFALCNPSGDWEPPLLRGACSIRLRGTR